MLAPKVHDLSKDPETVNRLNVNSYQQSAITSFRGYQYCAFYRTSSETPTARHVVLGRREVEDGDMWEYLEFDDYEQTTDDGHNTISMGICYGDGTIHLSFDHHGNDLNYRVSEKFVASHPKDFEWTPSLFGPIRHGFGGDNPTTLQLVTYPRFINIVDELLFEYRHGKAGAGSDIIYSYSALSSRFEMVGTYLVGVRSNPYPNGLTYDNARDRLHVSWTNRHFIEYEGADDPTSVVHSVQAGPNGPENNENLCYAFSNDKGRTWRLPGSDDYIDANVGMIGISSEAVAVRIPRDSGIMNQESQCVDSLGNFHVLNRDNVDGAEHWKHYQLGENKLWTTTVLPFRQPTAISARGKLVYFPESDAMYYILPATTTGDKLTILRAQRQQSGDFGKHEIIWAEEGFVGEVLIDEQAIMDQGRLYILTLKQLPTERRVVILEFSSRELANL